MKIQYLKFDSDLAGRHIGKYCLPQCLKLASLASQDLVLKFKEFDLIYLTAKFQENISQLKDFNYLLADIKITLSANLKNISFNKLKLRQSDFFQQNDTDRLLKLGTDLYKISRFYFDKHTRRLGKKIYQAWIKNSINKSLADEIIVQRDHTQRVIGFATLKISDSFAEPVLVKVDRSFSGQGYGRILMRKCYSFLASQHQDIEIRVHTQLKNLIALKLYQSFGLRIIDYNFIYHIYPRGFIKI